VFSFSEKELRDEIPKLRRYAKTLISYGPLEVDDLVQECLARAIDKQHLWVPGTNLHAWLKTMLYHLHINGVRNNIRHKHIAIELTDEMAVKCGRPCSQEISVELSEVIVLLNRLPEKLRRAVELGVNHSQERIACIENVPLGTAKSRLSRGREALRDSVGIGERRGRVRPTKKWA
jgi:RNA polymerase sigma-70 factor (ECF subfamily)